MEKPKRSERVAQRLADQRTREKSRRARALARMRTTHGFYGPDWPDARFAALSRDHWRCLLCGRPAMAVHHITRIGAKGQDPAKNRPENLISLCALDHARADDRIIGDDECRRLLSERYGYNYDGL